jgi:hypothetical protein
VRRLCLNCVTEVCKIAKKAAGSGSLFFRTIFPM